MARLGAVATRHPSTVVVIAALAVSSFVVVLQGGVPASAQRPGLGPADQALIERGRTLYLPGCSGCHGIQGQGLRAPGGAVRGPSLERSGEAAAYYYVHTGRMPLANSEDNPVRKAPAYSDSEIRALVAFVGSLGNGPRVPDVAVERGDLTEGGEIFRGNCAACHSASGAGGALSYGRAAPTLRQAEPRELGSAVRIGPGQMPEFGTQTISDRQLDSVARYVQYLRQPEDPGGLSLGRIGPIPEGFVVWVFGMGVLLVTVAWIGKRSRPTIDGEMLDEADG